MFFTIHVQKVNILKKLLLIYNPTSGKGRVGGELNVILDIFTKQGYLVTVYPTQNKGDAVRAARELGADFDKVVCAGGDGTLSETASGLLALPQPPVLGYIPVGSTNDCAKTLRLPRDAAKAAALCAGEGVPRPLDIGLFNSRPFVYVAAFGAFTEVSYETPQELKNAFGHLAYVIAGVASIPSITPYQMQVEYDGNVIEDKFYYGMVCNTISVGGMKVLPNDRVVLDDGLFEVILVRRPVNIQDLATGVQSLIQQTPNEKGPLLSFRTSKVTFTSPAPVPWTVDGEYGGSQTRHVVENCRKAITVIQGD